MAGAAEVPDQLDAIPSRATPAWPWVAGVCALAALLRLYRLSYRSLWHDELSTLGRVSYETIGETMIRGIVPDVAPPGFYLLEHFVVRSFGSSEAALRAPSVVFGVVAVAATCSLGTQLFARREGLLAGVILALNWSAIYYSQEARPYALLMAATSVSAACLVSILRAMDGGRAMPRWTAALFVVSASVAAYSHYFGLYAIGLQALSCALYLGLDWPRLTRVSALFMGVALLYAPWIPGTLADLGSSSWIGPPDIGVLWGYLSLLFFDHPPLTIAALVLLVLFGVACIRRGGGRPLAERMRSRDALLIVWCALPFAVVFAISLVATPVLTARNMIFVVPIGCLLLARATYFLLPERLAAWALPLWIVALLGPLLSPGGPYDRPGKEQIRESAEIVMERATPETSVVLTTHAYFLDYYFERFGSDLRAQPVARDLERFMDALERTERSTVFYVELHKPKPGPPSLLGSRYEVVYDTGASLARARVREYRVRPPGASGQAPPVRATPPPHAPPSRG